MLEKSDWKFLLKWKLRILLGNLDFRRKRLKVPILLLLYRLGVEDGWQGNAYTVLNLEPYYGKYSHIKRQTDRYIDQLSVWIRGEVVYFWSNYDGYTDYTSGKWVKDFKYLYNTYGSNLEREHLDTYFTEGKTYD